MFVGGREVQRRDASLFYISSWFHPMCDSVREFLICQLQSAILSNAQRIFTAMHSCCSWLHIDLRSGTLCSLFVFVFTRYVVIILQIIVNWSICILKVWMPQKKSIYIDIIYIAVAGVLWVQSQTMVGGKKAFLFPTPRRAPPIARTQTHG